MNKFSFINQLLQKEKFTSSQKERFLKLVSQELNTIENFNEKVWEEIKLIKEKIGITEKKASSKYLKFPPTISSEGWGQSDLDNSTQKDDETSFEKGLKILQNAAVPKPRKASVEEGMEILGKAIVKKESNNDLNYKNIQKSNDLKTDKPIKTEGSSLPKYIDPYHLYKFLFEYNQNPILRSTCHDVDSEELKKINEYCNSESYDFKSI